MIFFVCEKGKTKESLPNGGTKIWVNESQIIEIYSDDIASLKWFSMCLCSVHVARNIHDGTKKFIQADVSDVS